jgi:hypothetical protein
MPAALTARIEAALAAEAAARPTAAGLSAQTAAGLSGQTDGLAATGSHSDGPLSPPAGQTSPPADPKRPAPRTGGLAARRRTWTAGRPRLALTLAAAAAAVVVIGGGGYGLTQLLTSSTGPTSNVASGGSAAAPSAQGGVKAGPDHAAAGAHAPPANGTMGRVLHSGTNYQPAELRGQVTALLGRYTAAQPAPSSTAKRSALPSAMSPLVPACLASVLAGQRPLLVDEAKYQGRPAVIIVLPGPSGSRVLVEAAGCTATGKAHPLASTTLAK